MQQHLNVPPANHVKVLDGQGWVGLIDHLGSEATIVNAARVSFGKIKTEIDLRAPTEAGSHSESVIPGASLIYIPLGAYGDAFSDSSVGKQAYRKLFSTLANENNYPIYYHCTGGADRTGTISFLLNALLGLDEETLIKDYEFTSFSVYHMRNTKEGDYAPLFK